MRIQNVQCNALPKVSNANHSNTIQHSNPYSKTINSVPEYPTGESLQYRNFTLSISFNGLIHEYAKLGELESLNKLIRSGVDINSQDKDGWTPLKTACYYGQLEIVKELLAYPNIDVNRVDAQGYSPIFSSFWGGKNIVKLLLERNDIDINIQSGYDKITPLMSAVIYGKSDYVNMLLDRKDIDTTIENEKGQTALDYYCEAVANINHSTHKRLKEVTEYQLKHPETICNINKKIPVNISKLSPEENIWTKEEITAKFEKLVISNKYDEAADMLNKTPLINLDKKVLDSVCLTGNSDFAEKVFDYKRNQTKLLEEYEQKRKVFLEATIKNLSYEKLKANNLVLNTPNGIKALMSHREFNPNDKYDNKTLFEIICNLNSEGDLVKSILSKYDDVIVDNAKKTRNTTIKSLIEYYENVGKFKVKLENIKSKLSNSQTREAAVESLNEFVSSDKFDPEMTDSVGNDVLHIISAVASDGSREIIQKVLDKGGKVDSLNIGNQTPIMSAIKGLMIAKTEDEKSGLLSNIKFLLDKGADVDAQDLNDQTVFHYVCRTLSVALLIMFLAKKPNVFIEDKYGSRAAKYLQSQEMRDVYQKYIIG